MKQAILAEILSRPDAPNELLPKTLAKLHRSLIRQLQLQFAVAFLGTTAVFLYVLRYWKSASSEVSESSFGNLTRLAFSDPDIISVNIKDTLLGLLESLPTTIVLVGLVFLFFLLGTIGLILRFRTERQSQDLNSLSLTHHSNAS